MKDDTARRFLLIHFGNFQVVWFTNNAKDDFNQRFLTYLCRFIRAFYTQKANRTKIINLFLPL